MTETYPYVVNPYWTLRGGYSHLCVYRTDTKEAIVTKQIRSMSFQEEVETVPAGDGTLAVSARVHAVAPEVASWAFITALRRWKDDGADVRAILVSARYGPHLIWDEDVPIVLQGLNPGLNTLAGDSLLLHTSKAVADVEHSADLLGTNLGGTWSGSTDRVLPIPGLTVYAIGPGATVEAFNRAGASLGAATAASTALVLPSDVWSVTVTASARAALVTRLADTFVVLYVASDSALFTAGSETLYTG